MCQRVSVDPAHTKLKSSTFQQQPEQMVDREESQGKITTSFKCAAPFCPQKERFDLQLFMRVAATPIIVFLLLCNVALMIQIEVKQFYKITVTCCLFCDFLLCVCVCLIWSRTLRGGLLTERGQDRHIRAAYRQMAVSDDAWTLAS